MHLSPVCTISEANFILSLAKDDVLALDRGNQHMPPSPNKHSSRKVFTWDKIKLALTAAEEGFYIWNIKTGVIHYTDRCLSMMGASRTEEAPNIFTQPELTIHEDDRSFFTQEVRRYLDGHSHMPMRIEIRMKTLNSKSWSWVRVNGIARRDNQRRPIMLIGVWVNITRRKTAELRAAEDRDLFHTLIEHIPDSIYFKNRESRFVLANTSTANKLGVPTPADLIGRTDTYFFDKTMSDISRKEEIDIMQTGRPIQARLHHETWLHKGDTWSQISKFPWYGRNGDLKGIVGISSDVTNLVKAEIKVRETARILEERNKSLEKEIDLAREIQFALLPYEIPSRTHTENGVTRQVDFQHIFTPSEGVAGDWFDAFPVGDSGVGAIVCDVMGHGIRAALIASMLRGLMEQLSHLADNPAAFLTSLNHQLAKILQRAHTTMFASAVYIYLDLETGIMTVSTAGHPHPIVLGPDGIARKLLLPKGMAMGLLDTATYQNAQFPLLNGSRILMYTDGLTEAANDEGEELGTERLINHFNATKFTSTKDFVHQALTCAAKFTGCTNQADDICMLGISYVEQEAYSDT